MKKSMVLSLLLVGLLVFGLGMGTYAWFTSDATSTGNEFTSGTLALDINDSGTSYDLNFGSIDLGNLQPSDVTDEVNVTIENDGSLNLVWFGKFELTGADFDELSEALYIDYMEMEFLNPDTGNWEPNDEFIVNGRGAGTHADYYNNLADNDLMNVISLKTWRNANAMGAGDGVQIGALKPGYKYRLNFKLGFAPLAGNEYQGLGDSATDPFTLKYVVSATQVNVEAINALLNATIGGNLIDWFNAQLDKQL